jgi:hypothetical protein
MQKNKNIFLALLVMLLAVAACNEEYNMGEFNADSSLMPGARTDGPLDPSAIVASFDDYCDKVELSWLPTVRTSAYDVYRNGELLAQDLTDTFYVDTDALTTETEYTVYSKNINGSSEGSVSVIGRMSTIPLVPENFMASDGEFETKVDLSWDAANFAKHYMVKRGDIILSDNVVGTAYSDNVDAPQEDTEYSVIAIGVCGESDPAMAIGKADSMLKYSIIIDENFDGFESGFNLSSLPTYHHIFQYDITGGPGSFTVSADDAVSGAKSAIAIYNDVNANTSAAGAVEVQVKNFTLLVGQRYRLSYKIKCAIATTLHVAVDGDESGNPSKGDGLENYLLPSAVNSKNGNIFGIQSSAAAEWREVSYEFPAAGNLAQNNLDPDATELGWTPTTIQAGQESPIIAIKYWVGKNKAPGKKNPPIFIDDLKIELVK